MTLLTIVQDAADQVGVYQPTTVVGNTDPDAAKFLRLSQKVGRKLISAYDWQALRKEVTFTAAAAEEQSGVIPVDFDRFVPETFWDRSNVYLVSGPISAVEWQGLKANDISGNVRKFIYRGGSVFTVPAFAGTESCAFEYISTYWVDTDADGVGEAAAWAADTNTSLIDEELVTLGLVYEYLAGEGLPAKDAGAAYLDRYKQITQNDQKRTMVLVAGDIFGGGRHFTGTPAVNAARSLLG
jgi:hypothetical protein